MKSSIIFFNLLLIIHFSAFATQRENPRTPFLAATASSPLLETNNLTLMLHQPKQKTTFLRKAPSHNWTMVLKKTKEPIGGGQCNKNIISAGSIKLSSQDNSNELGTEALSLLRSLAFEHLQHTKLRVTVASNNRAHQEMCLAMGFNQKKPKKSGHEQTYNRIIMQMTKKQFLSQKAHIQ